MMSPPGGLGLGGTCVDRNTGCKTCTGDGRTACPTAAEESKTMSEGKSLEATIGIEPMNKGFADPRLTTWLRRLIETAKIDVPETRKAA
jgi:hypothetical protein